MSEKNLEITVLYDNVTDKEDLTAGWGFSALVSVKGTNILFDTGADLMTLSNNMSRMKIEPKEIDAVFISHNHCDHVGGLSAVLEENSNLKIYILDSFGDLGSKVKAYEAEPVIINEPTGIEKNLYSSGPMVGKFRGMKVYEHSLIVKTVNGPVVIVGCAHPGIETVVKKAGGLIGESVSFTIGGFHLCGKDEDEIQEVVEAVHPLTERVMPAHCTGKKATELFRKAFGDGFIECGVGKILE